MISGQQKRPQSSIKLGGCDLDELILQVSSTPNKVIVIFERRLLIPYLYRIYVGFRDSSLYSR